MIRETYHSVSTLNHSEVEYIYISLHISLHISIYTILHTHIYIHYITYIYNIIFYHMHISNSQKVGR